MQVTYSSDYFPQLFDLAVELIKRGCAYVDHQVYHCYINIPCGILLIFRSISSYFLVVVCTVFGFHLCCWCLESLPTLTGSCYLLTNWQTAEEIKLYRSEKKDSPWRNRPIEESLKLFEDMRRGLIDEGKATLRMKQDMKNENPNMYDLIAYRIKVRQ